jgi:hypothetical protein
VSSQIIEPTANAIRDLIETVTLSEGITLKGYTWEPREFDRVPAGAVGVPEVRRTGLDEGENQQSTTDWFMDFPVGLYFDLDEARKSQRQCVEGLEGFIAALDGSPDLGLGGAVCDSKVTGAVPFTEDQRHRTLIGHLCTVSVWRWVAD